MELKYHFTFEVCSFLFIYNGEILKIKVGCHRKHLFLSTLEGGGVIRVNGHRCQLTRPHLSYQVGVTIINMGVLWMNGDSKNR